MVLSLSRFFQNSRLNQETEQRSTFAAEQSEQLASANAEIARLRQELQTKEDDIRVKNREIDDLNFSKSRSTLMGAITASNLCSKTFIGLYLKVCKCSFFQLT